MKKVAILIGAMLSGSIVGCTAKPKDTIQSVMEITHPDGKVITYTDTCTSDYDCRQQVIENTRTMYLGGDQTLYCNMSGDLFIRMDGSYNQESFQVVPQNGLKCTFSVKSIGIN